LVDRLARIKGPPRLVQVAELLDWNYGSAGMTRRNRRGGTFDRPVSAHPELRHVNDGGRDAPLSTRGVRIYHWIIGGIFVVGVALLLLSR
jgi:hypothetical protein